MDAHDALLAEAAEFPAAVPAARLWCRLDWLDRVDRLQAGTPALEAARLQVEAGNERLFEELRADLRRGQGDAALAALLAARPGAGAPPQAREGFDAVDELFAGLLRLPAPDAPEIALDADMVAYQPTPARHVLDLLARTGLRADDLLVDLGAGLGQVPMLAALCSPARALGIEIEPALVRSARQAADGLALSRVAFLCQDAGVADLSSGTVFYLYTPLRGARMAALLERLRAEAARRPLRVCGFGPCVDLLARQAWLRPQGEVARHRVTVFSGS